jgi:hypothetical protein
MPSDASYMGQNAAVMEHEQGSKMCKTIQFAGISMTIIYLMYLYTLVQLPRLWSPGRKADPANLSCCRSDVDIYKMRNIV